MLSVCSLATVCKRDISLREKVRQMSLPLIGLTPKVSDLIKSPEPKATNEPKFLNKEIMVVGASPGRAIHEQAVSRSSLDASIGNDTPVPKKVRERTSDTQIAGEDEVPNGVEIIKTMRPNVLTMNTPEQGDDHLRVSRSAVEDQDKKIKDQD